MTSVYQRIAIALALFVACTAASLFAWYIAASLSLATAGWIMGAGGRDFTTGESVFFIIALLLPFVLYPTSGWLFRKRLGRSVSITLGLCPVIFPFLFFWMIDVLRYLDRKNNEHPPDGIVETVYHDRFDGDLQTFNTYKNNQLVETTRVCPDGAIRYHGVFKDEKKIGTHYEIENCRSSDLSSLTTYGDDEKVLDMKKFEQESKVVFVHSFVEDSGGSEIRHYRRYRIDPSTNQYYLATEEITYGGARSVSRQFDENGTLVSEK